MSYESYLNEQFAMTVNETNFLFLQNLTTIPSYDQTTDNQSFILSQQHIQISTTNSLPLSTTTAISSTILTTHLQHTVITSWMDWFSSGRVQIPLYATILLLAIVGNSLVIMTLVQNRRMRTITNVFLLNLAVSDILLGVLCMPFTLAGTLLRDFVFGEIMCKFLPYLQGKTSSTSYTNNEII